MKRIATILVFLSICNFAVAQSLDMRLGVKAGLRGVQADNEWVSEGSGFYGDRFCLYLNGTLNEHFSYSMRHSLNKGMEYKELFQATDWLYLKYKADNGWYVSGGKVWMEYGSYEYDGDPINIYFYGMSNGTFNCFLPGAGFGKYLNDGKDILSLQATRSPYCAYGDNGMFSYNFSWRGDHGWYKPLFSFNALQMGKKTYEYHLALGNRIEKGPLLVEFDLIDKFLDGKYGFWDNTSVILNTQYRFSDKFQVVAKYTADCEVLLDKGFRQLGAACEYYPIPDVRVFAFCQGNFGRNDKYYGVIGGETAFGAGVVWYINLINK